MSEKYPRAWSILSNGWWRGIYHARTAAEMATQETSVPFPEVVELIPLPEHQAIVAAAVAAAVERCAGIADAVEAETMPVNRSFRDHFDQERGDTAAEIARKIREVPK